MCLGSSGYITVPDFNSLIYSHNLENDWSVQMSEGLLGTRYYTNTWVQDGCIRCHPEAGLLRQETVPPQTFIHHIGLGGREQRFQSQN